MEDIEAWSSGGGTLAISDAGDSHVSSAADVHYDMETDEGEEMNSYNEFFNHLRRYSELNGL
eukprot:11954581-Heterocapsa_arctica.AAC.1